MMSLFRMSKTTLWRHVKEGRVPEPIYIGRSPLWQKSLVEQWIGGKSASQPKKVEQWVGGKSASQPKKRDHDELC